MRALAIAALLGVAGCAKRPSADAPPPPPAIEVQRERAAEEGVDQTLERARLASLAIAEGDVELADATLRQVVIAMQDFRADGQFRATVGAESNKEWKGDPYEKMMAFLYLGTLLLEKGDYGNALAMSKSAILADTGTSRFQYRADFVAGFVLQALAYDGLGEKTNADRAITQAVDALYVRVLTDHLSAHLTATQLPGDYDSDVVEAARVLLLSGIPAGLMARPRDVDEAISGALSRATDLRLVVAQSKRKDWPGELQLLKKGPTKKTLDVLSPLTEAWRQAVRDDDVDPTVGLERDEAFLRSLVDDDPSLVVWVEAGRGPRKIGTGEYGHILQIQPRGSSTAPDVLLDGRSVTSQYVDSVTYQATTRGSRRVDGFLKGKAVFKDAAPALGWALLVSGDIANALREPGDNGTLSTILYIAGAATWVAGAVTNPRADTRAWLELPDTLWLVSANTTPGTHELRVDGRDYIVDIPDRGTVHHLVTALPPGGVRAFGKACRKCDAPLAIPQEPTVDGETP